MKAAGLPFPLNPCRCSDCGRLGYYSCPDCDVQCLGEAWSASGVRRLLDGDGSRRGRWLIQISRLLDFSEGMTVELTSTRSVTGRASPVFGRHPDVTASELIWPTWSRKCFWPVLMGPMVIAPQMRPRRIAVSQGGNNEATPYSPCRLGNRSHSACSRSRKNRSLYRSGGPVRTTADFREKL